MGFLSEENERTAMLSGAATENVCMSDQVPTSRSRMRTSTSIFLKVMPPKSVPDLPLSKTPKQYAPASAVCMNK
jgi:hypothetical protein